MTPSKALVAAASGIILGIATGSFTTFSWGIVMAVFLVGIFLLIIGGRQSLVAFLGLIFIFLTFGFTRASLVPLSLTQETSFFDEARESLVERSSRIISGQEHAMFSAMVLGEKSLLSNKTKDEFSVTGTRHILAISGMHLTIVAVFLWQGLISVGFWRRQAFWGSLFGIAIFVLLVGSPPSAVRAGVMAALYLLARQVGRPSQAWRLLLVAAAAMLLVNPELLAFSIGFQLSFLAVLGIIFFVPFFDRLFSFISWDGLRSLLSVSLAAQITTWPIIAVNFGMFSVIGVLANLVVVPLLPIIMTLGLGFLAVGWWSLTLSKIFLWPTMIILKGVGGLISFLAALSWSSIDIESFALPLFIFYYLALAAFLVIFRKHLSDEL